MLLRALRPVVYRGRHLRGDLFEAPPVYARTLIGTSAAERVRSASEPTSQGDQTMSREVDKVTDLVEGTVSKIEKRAEGVCNKLETAMSEVNESLDIADRFGDAMHNAAHRLKGFFRLHTNNPPEDAVIVGEDKKALPPQ